MRGEVFSAGEPPGPHSPGGAATVNAALTKPAFPADGYHAVLRVNDKGPCDLTYAVGLMDKPSTGWEIACRSTPAARQRLMPNKHIGRVLGPTRPA